MEYCILSWLTEQYGIHISLLNQVTAPIMNIAKAIPIKNWTQA
ncbi:MAG: hypothetical protein HY929_02930 [Euryarchaeota archaeon]|nr:hypothetical protein [Euryarchaeota archaeon]